MKKKDSYEHRGLFFEKGILTTKDILRILRKAYKEKNRSFNILCAVLQASLWLNFLPQHFTDKCFFCSFVDKFKIKNK